MKPCHRNDDGDRLTGPRHDGDHLECARCEETHCGCCSARHVDPKSNAHPRTCVRCQEATRGHLSACETLVAHLPAQAAYGGRGGLLEAARPIPGGDAQVLLAWGGDSTTSAADESEDDPIPALLLLSTWEDTWRKKLGHRGGPRPTMSNVCGYLHQHLGWAAQRHDAFPYFAEDMRKLRSRLENVLHDGERDDTVAAPCFDCAGQLVRLVDDDGRSDRYTCRRCHREMDVAGYWLAVRAHHEAQAAAATTAQAKAAG